MTKKSKNIFSMVISVTVTADDQGLRLCRGPGCSMAPQTASVLGARQSASDARSDLDVTSSLTKAACTAASLSSAEGRCTASSGRICDHRPVSEGLLEDKIFLNSKYSQRNTHPEGVMIRTLFPSPDTYKYSLKELAENKTKQ